MKTTRADAVRRGGPLAMLAAGTASVLVVGAVGILAYTAHRGSSGVDLASATGSPSSSSADDADRDAARAEAQALLDATPLPDGAVPQDTSPSTVLDHQDQGGPLEQDTSLDRYTWWTVPMSTSDYAAYVTANPPPGLTGSGSASGTITDTHAGTTTSWTEEEFTGTDTDACTPPQLWLTWTAVDGGTAVRAEAYIAARWPRSQDSVVTGRINRVDVRITGARKPVSKSYTGRRTTARLRTLFNGLLGAVHNEGKALVANAPGFAESGATSVAFHLADGDVVRARDAASLTVRRNGRRVLPPLDPSGFDAGVAAIAK